MYITCDTAAHVRGADLFKPEWLATVTQVTFPHCKVSDSHLTLLSSEYTVHGWREEREASLPYGFLPYTHGAIYLHLHAPRTVIFIYLWGL